MTNPAPGYRKYPNHPLHTEPARARVQVRLGNELIADSERATVMHEGAYPPVYYLPRADVKMERLARTDHRTHCPFKGDASYYSVEGGAENAVWSYEQPYDEMLAIKELVAFYPDKFEIKAG